jgi:hypothetical protein
MISILFYSTYFDYLNVNNKLNNKLTDFNKLNNKLIDLDKLNNKLTDFDRLNNKFTVQILTI